MRRRPWASGPHHREPAAPLLPAFPVFDIRWRPSLVLVVVFGIAPTAAAIVYSPPCPLVFRHR